MCNQQFHSILRINIHIIFHIAFAKHSLTSKYWLLASMVLSEQFYNLEIVYLKNFQIAYWLYLKSDR